MSEYDDLLLDAYKGEIFGDAFFGALAVAQPDPDRREKLRLLQTMRGQLLSMLHRLESVNSPGCPASPAPRRKRRA